MNDDCWSGAGCLYKEARIDTLTERVRVLEADGPQMRRGSHGDGTDWMGSMRECLNDAMQAASAEASWGDEARAEAKQLRERVRVLREALEAIGRQCNAGLADHLRLSRIESIAAEAMEKTK